MVQFSSWVFAKFDWELPKSNYTLTNLLWLATTQIEISWSVREMSWTLCEGELLNKKLNKINLPTRGDWEVERGDREQAQPALSRKEAKEKRSKTQTFGKFGMSSKHICHELIYVSTHWDKAERIHRPIVFYFLKLIVKINKETSGSAIKSS